MKKFTKLFSLIVGINSCVLFNSVNAMYSTKISTETPIPITVNENKGYVDPAVVSILDSILSKLKEKLGSKNDVFYLALKSELDLIKKEFPQKNSFEHLWMMINSSLNTWPKAYAGIYINPISDTEYGKQVIGVRLPNSGSGYERISRNIKSDKIIYEIEFGKLYKYYFSIEISNTEGFSLKIVLSGKIIGKSEEITLNSIGPKEITLNSIGPEEITLNFKEAFYWFKGLCNSFKNKK